MDEWMDGRTDGRAGGRGSACMHVRTNTHTHMHLALCTAAMIGWPRRPDN